jgi:hypothetical protein
MSSHELRGEVAPRHAADHLTAALTDMGLSGDAYRE